MARRSRGPTPDSGSVASNRCSARSDRVRRRLRSPKCAGGCRALTGTLTGRPQLLRSRRVPRDPVKNGDRTSRGDALLAQSVEHSHGKAGVVGSIPTEGSTTFSVLGLRSRAGEQKPRRRSSVGQSIRLIIGRSSVQVRSPLLHHRTKESSGRGNSEQREVRAE